MCVCVCESLEALEPVASYLATALQATVEFAVVCLLEEKCRGGDGVKGETTSFL